ncbi:MAG TPA: hypothetical protein VEC36_00300 [Patescibacteria group bacterium]|nr:hypothetical protein [Patescibacteria group bacterium]
MKRAGNKVIERVAAKLGVAVSTVHYRLDHPDCEGYDRAIELLKEYQEEYVQSRPLPVLKARARRKEILRGED